MKIQKIKNHILLIAAWAAALTMMCCAAGIGMQEPAMFLAIIKVYMLAAAYLGLFIVANIDAVIRVTGKERKSGEEGQKKSA